MNEGPVKVEEIAEVIVLHLGSKKAFNKKRALSINRWSYVKEAIKLLIEKWFIEWKNNEIEFIENWKYYLTESWRYYVERFSNLILDILSNKKLN